MFKNSNIWWIVGIWASYFLVFIFLVLLQWKQAEVCLHRNVTGRSVTNNFFFLNCKQMFKGAPKILAKKKYCTFGPFKSSIFI